jgi:L-seryl-tRNA(Ser) seleniumtransferase
MTPNPRLRDLPSVQNLISSASGQHLSQTYGREAVLMILRETLTATRTQLVAGESIPVEAEVILQRVKDELEAQFLPGLRPVINATGVIIHTNLGRAPLSEAAQEAIREVAAQYNTLEFDLESGKRGSRLRHASDLLATLTGGEAALVVNNTAAALVLLLSALALGREVIISRGQLVEIGGGFRVPEVMTQSGAKLVEVGATNRTRPADYVKAITPNTAMLMHTHASNFKQIGFVEEASLSEIASIAHEHGLLLVDDLGSGALLDTAQYGLEHEPRVQESIAAGVDLVTFSGDKLLGAPQAGILVGKKALINILKEHPLARAVRADKLCLAGLVATLDHYRRGEAVTHVPIWRMIATPLSELRSTAERWAAITGGTVVEGQSAVGGGSLPGETLPTALLALDVPSADAFAARLRKATLPIIARISEGRVLFDPRTVLPGQEDALLAGIQSARAL